MADIVKHKFNELLHFVFPKNCFEELILNLNIFHQECVPLVASRAIGLAITAGAMFLFIPQILKIQRARSAEGISLISMLLGLVPALGTCAYSYEKQFVFSQYGDSVFVAIQMSIIVMQILYFSDNAPYAFAFMATMWAIVCAIMYHYIPFNVLYGIQAAGIPFIIVSKGIQILANYRNQSTGQLAFITVALQFGGCLARIFTSLTETDDRLVLFVYLVASALNGIVFAQFFMYWGNKTRKQKKA
jgi:mannose-P-dolichol utilization defect protein 1|uniref:Mannose-P-dolichol utilization defect 1 protein homolog n=1 Tax=Panagrolaimus sp. PS1159 TaxID=55785 RepID=A0AC35FCH0_9BILA